MWIYHILLIHSSGREHLGFYLLAAGNNAAVNMGVQRAVSVPAFSLLFGLEVLVCLSFLVDWGQEAPELCGVSLLFTLHLRKLPCRWRHDLPTVRPSYRGRARLRPLASATHVSHPVMLPPPLAQAPGLQSRMLNTSVHSQTGFLGPCGSQPDLCPTSLQNLASFFNQEKAVGPESSDALPTKALGPVLGPLCPLCPQ